MHNWLTNLVHRGYESKLGDIAISLGLRNPFKEMYARILFYFSSDTTTVSISGCNADFFINSPQTAFEVHQNIKNESPIISNFIEQLDEDDIFYDIGAGIGSYSCIVGTNIASTIAFEPDTDRYRMLNENLSRNNISGQALQVALGQVSGAEETNEFIDAAVENGDEIIEKMGLPAPDLVKIDVDGPELHVLRGLGETLKDKPRLIWIEVHPNRLARRGHSIDDLVRFLTELDFFVEEKRIRGLKSPFIRAYRY